MWPLLALGSAFFVALKDTFSKGLLNREVKPSQILFEDAFLYTIFVLALFFYKITFSISLINTYYFIGKSILYISAILLFFTLLKKSEVSTLLPLMNLSPIFLIILSHILLSETISFLQLVGVGIIVVATFYLEITIRHHDKQDPHKHHLSLFKKFDGFFIFKIIILMICFSFLAILDKTIMSQGINVYTNIFFTYGLMLTFMGIYLISKKLLRVSIKEIIRIPSIAITAMFGMISSYLVLFAISYPGAFVSLVIPLRRTSTLVGSLLGGLLFHEKHLKKKMTCIGIMIIGIFLIAL